MNDPTAATLKGRVVLVAGLGASGAAAAAALARAGSRVRAVDAGGDSTVRERARNLDALGIPVRVDVPFDRAGLLDGVELVVASPGVPQGSPLLAGALARGVPVWSEPELAWRLTGGRTSLLAVTGTNGKTTTTELLGRLLGVPTAGNIGTPLVELLAPSAGAPPPVAVAELSSFQLRFCDRLRADVAVLLNVAPDHLDWHGDLAAYDAAKARVWANHDDPDRHVAVVNADDAGAQRVRAAHPPAARQVGFTLRPPAPDQVGVVDGFLVERVSGDDARRIVACDELALPGPHNLANACAALAAALAAGARPDTLHTVLRAFVPGPHRLERVVDRGGVVWVNDSKATNPHAAAAALSSFPPRDGRPRVIWIAGGLNKGLDFDDLTEPLRRTVRAAVTIGSAGPQIAALARALGIETHEAGDLTTAVAVAAGRARPGDTVLLAPACASMDQFRDYAERGGAFRGLVGALDAPAVGGPAEDADEH